MSVAVIAIVIPFNLMMHGSGKYVKFLVELFDAYGAVGYTPVLCMSWFDETMYKSVWALKIQMKINAVFHNNNQFSLSMYPMEFAKSAMIVLKK